MATPKSPKFTCSICEKAFYKHELRNCAGIFDRYDFIAGDDGGYHCETCWPLCKACADPEAPKFYCYDCDLKFYKHELTEDAYGDYHCETCWPACQTCFDRFPKSEIVEEPGGHIACKGCCGLEYLSDVDD